MPVITQFSMLSYYYYYCIIISNNVNLFPCIRNFIINSNNIINNDSLTFFLLIRSPLKKSFLNSMGQI